MLPRTAVGGRVRGWRRRQAGPVRPGADLARDDSHVRRVRERHRRRHGARGAAHGQPGLSLRVRPLRLDARHPAGRPAIWISLSVDIEQPLHGLSQFRRHPGRARSQGTGRVRRGHGRLSLLPRRGRDAGSGADRGPGRRRKRSCACARRRRSRRGRRSSTSGSSMRFLWNGCNAGSRDRIAIRRWRISRTASARSARLRRNLPQRRKPRIPISRSLAAVASLVPRRKALLVPTHENLWPDARKRIRDSGVRAPWALFWADGKRSLAEIAEAISVETGREVSLESVVNFFNAHADIGYVDLRETS